MKKILCALILAFSLAAAALSRAEAVSPTPAPEWKLKDVDGKEISSAQFRGKVIVIDFWATWCGPCRHEIPGYIDLQKKYEKQGLVIIGIAVSDSAKSVKGFVAEQGVNYTVVMGDDAVVEAFGGVEGIPTTFVIDRDGMIRDRKVGAMDTAAYEQTIRKFLR
jgi:peroxiredoxin